MDDYFDLLYLDRAFISALYETKTGAQAETKITSSDTIHASARIPIFSGGASSIESRSYSISTIGMLSELKDHLAAYPEIDAAGAASSHGYFWADGTLTVHVFTRSKTERDPATGKSARKKSSEQPYFAIDASGLTFALIPTDDYFMSGIVGLRELHDTVVGSVDIKVKALLRVISAQTSFQQFIAIPLVVYEQ